MIVVETEWWVHRYSLYHLYNNIYLKFFIIESFLKSHFLRMVSVRPTPSVFYTLVFKDFPLKNKYFSHQQLKDEELQPSSSGNVLLWANYTLWQSAQVWRSLSRLRNGSTVTSYLSALKVCGHLTKWNVKLYNFGKHLAVS